MIDLERTKEQRPQGISSEAALAALEAILHSKAFSHSPSLRQALAFIVRQSIASPQNSIKEYTIATEVLGRSRDFDPKTDNIVRVQMHRLREKLTEYYLTEGQNDAVHIAMPRGQYLTEFVRIDTEAPLPTPAPPPVVGLPEVRRRRLDWRWAVMILLAVSNLVLMVYYRRPFTRLSSPLQKLWEPFLAAGRPPLIVYSNPAFLLGKPGILHRYDSPTILSMATGSRIETLNDPGTAPKGSLEPGPFVYLDSYTGSGEVVAAVGITQFLCAHGQPFDIRRSRLVSYEDIKDTNVIFLGWEKEDQMAKKLPMAQVVQELICEPPPRDQYLSGTRIRDLDPPPGHPAIYAMQLDPSTGAIQADYGLISLLPSVSPGHYVLCLGGITTLGTQAAAGFVVSERSMAIWEQMPEVAAVMKSGSHYFQALLEVQVRDGVPLDVKCVLVRALKPPAR
jgi:hypothetical protein